VTEFLVNMHVHVPHSVSEQHREELLRAEAERAAELADAGTIVRLWRTPGQRANWGLWEADGPTALHEAISSLPLFPYLQVEVIALAHHPNDPSRRA
jgi:muconolactone D-isomerase